VQYQVTPRWLGLLGVDFYYYSKLEATQPSELVKSHLEDEHSRDPSFRRLGVDKEPILTFVNYRLLVKLPTNNHWICGEVQITEDKVL
jgi:hypothetical protein